MYKEERGVLEEEMRKMEEFDMEKFGALDSSEKTIAILGDRWWPQAAKQEGIKTSEKKLRMVCITWEQRIQHPTIGGLYWE